MNDLRQADPSAISIATSPADRMIGCLSLAFASFAAIDGNMAMMVGCIGVPVAVVWLARLVRDNKRRSGGLRAIVYSSVVAIMLAGPAACSIHTMRAENGLQPVIAALDHAFARTGQYPVKLGELVPAATAVCGGTLNRQAQYHSVNGGQRYFLTCMTYGMNHHTYDSDTRRWRDWD